MKLEIQEKIEAELMDFDSTKKLGTTSARIMKVFNDFYLLESKKLEEENKKLRDHHQDLRSVEINLAKLKAEKEFLKSKGLTVGKMKTSDKPAPYLAYIIEEGSELCELKTLVKLTETEIKLEAIERELEEVKDELKKHQHPHWSAHPVFSEIYKNGKRIEELVIKKDEL